MQNTSSVLLTILLLLSGIYQTSAQLTISGFSDLNDVYSLNYHNDTMWIGSSGGVVYRVLSNFSQENILTKQNHGLGSNFITAIEVDNDGNKFFGSFDNGVTIYNAGAITVFNSSSGPLNDRIFCLAKDNSGHIWAGTPTGAYRFNGSTWDSFNTASEVPGEVRAISADGSNVWFGTFGDGLYRYDGTNWFTETTADGNIVSNDITALAVRNDSLLVGTSSGISFFNPNGSIWTTETVGANEDVFDLEIGNSGIFYASTSDGLYSSGGSVWNKEGMFPTSPTGDIEIRDFEIWVGFNEYGGGVQPFDFSTPPPPYMVTGPQYPGKNEVSDIISHNSQVYVTTPGNGLSIYDGLNWTVINSDMPSLDFHSMAFQADTLWLASHDNGTARYFAGVWESFVPIDIDVNAVAIDKNDINRIWCGTSTGGAYSLYDRIVENNFTVADGLLSVEVIAITVDSNNDVWFLHKTGATIYNGSTFSTVTVADLGVNTAQLNDIDADLSGGVWIASTEGVIEYNAGTITNYTTADGLSDNHVTSVHIDNRNYKFFGTFNSGISIRSDHGWQRIAKINGILTDRITAVNYESGTNLIWSAGKWGGISNTFIEPISVAISPFSTQICYGNTITLNADVAGGFGSGSYNYSWTSSDGGFTSTNQFETIQPTNSVTYTLEANDGYNGGSINASVMINFIDTSDITGPDTICPNSETVYYSATDAAGTSKTYSWGIDGGNITSDVSSSFIDVVWFMDRDFGSLYLTETDANSCMVTQQFDVNIMRGAIPEIILKRGENLLICLDSGLVYYQWYRDDIPIPEANRQFYYLDEKLGSVDGIYHVEVDASSNCKLKSITQEVYRTKTKAYPVPTKSVLNIDFSNNKIANGKITIRSFQGILIDEIPFIKETELKRFELDVSQYKPGTYLYTINLDSERIKTGKFIIN